MEFRFLPQDSLYGLVRTSDGKRWCAIAMMAGGGLVVGGMVADALWLDSSPAVALTLLTATGGIITASWLGFMAARRWERQRLVESTMLLCCRCRHPVVANGAGDGVICPECGRGDQAALLRKRWEEAYHVKLSHQRARRGAERGERREEAKTLRG